MIADRIEAQLSDARLRILVVGAGIAGSTLTALMRQRGARIALIEQGPETQPSGYMLGLMPLGGRVLEGLGLTPSYRDESVEMRHYALHNRHGKLIRRYPLAPLVDQFGDWRGIERDTLLGLLRHAAGDLVYNATVERLIEAPGGATVTLSDESQVTVDLVVVADGIHSPTRSLILDAGEVDAFDTGWGGFVTWATLSEQRIDTYSELWARGWGIGLYPVPGRLGVFLGGRHNELSKRDADDFATRLESRARSEPFASALRNRDRTHPGFYWRMSDIRARTWSRGHAILLGDAAAAFLPTAGIGASVAMDSAAALSDELSRADAAHITHALALYEARQRDRVERAQRNSRALARYMFVDSPMGAWARDQLMRIYTLRMMTRSIAKVMTGR